MKRYAPILITALFIVVKIYKQPKSIDKENVGHIYNGKEKKLLLFVKTWMNLENIKLPKVQLGGGQANIPRRNKSPIKKREK